MKRIVGARWLLGVGAVCGGLQGGCDDGAIKASANASPYSNQCTLQCQSDFWTCVGNEGAVCRPQCTSATTQECILGCTSREDAKCVAKRDQCVAACASCCDDLSCQSPSEWAAANCSGTCQSACMSYGYSCSDCSSWCGCTAATCGLCPPPPPPPSCCDTLSCGSPAEWAATGCSSTCQQACTSYGYSASDCYGWCGCTLLTCQF
jgi:hypothetical protein